MLRRLAEQQDYPALHDACLATGSAEPGVQVLLALADAHLGDPSAAERTLASLDGDTLALDVRLDLAAVHMALGALDQAIAILESIRQAATRRKPHGPDKLDHALLAARLAWCRLQQGQDDQAVALYQRSLTLRPLLAVYQNLLRLYRDRGRLTDMARCLDAAWHLWEQQQTLWPEGPWRLHGRQMRAMQLDLWLAEERLETAEAWVDSEQEVLDEGDWCALLAELAERLKARGRHAQAEEWLRSGLRCYPEHLALYRQLAELAQLQGRTLQAIALLRRAISLANAQNQPTGSLWIRLSAVTLPYSPGRAREAAERARDQLAERTGPNAGGADEAAGLRFQVELALANVEAEERDYCAAEQRYRRLLEQRPDMVPALQALGHLCLQLGRIDEAVAQFQRITAIDPARGYGALIHVRRLPDDVDTLLRLEQLARAPDVEGPLRTALLFQLATAWEKREEHARAFALADEANAASRAQLHYDPRAHRERCARIRHAFPAALYRHRAGCGHESRLPVFVVGMPRSGTTLVEQMLAGHSRIHGAGELGVIPRVIAGLERWERYTGSGRHYPDCVDDLDPAVSRGIAENVLRELREYGPDADHVVDKLPHNFENIGLIRLLFPNAKVISVRRDARDVAISNYFLDYASKHAGMGFAYHLDWIGEQLADHNLLMHHWHQLWPDGILEIHYEDIVDHPEASARRMLSHIGVDWEPQVLDFDALERPVRTASVWQVRQPLYASAKGRWRRYRQYLKPLIAATNRTITSEPVEMVTLPEAGWLNSGVDRYRQGDLDTAEYRFKQLLHHVPEHAAARFMLGLIYLRKGHTGAGVPLMEQAVERCPWNRHWRSDLAQAYRLVGRHDDAAALTRTHPDQTAAPAEAHSGEDGVRLDYLFLSEESTCSRLGPARSGTHC